MYNEVKRFYLFRRRRWADTLFDTLYHIIFILGFYSLLRGNPDFYRRLLEETEVLQFNREHASLEDLLYEVLK